MEKTEARLEAHAFLLETLLALLLGLGSAGGADETTEKMRAALPEKLPDGPALEEALQILANAAATARRVNEIESS